MQATQLPEPAAVPVQRPASPALAPALRTISGETPHYRARFEVAAADGADAAEAVKERVVERLSMASSVYSVCSMVRGCGVSDPSSLLQAARERRVERVSR